MQWHPTILSKLALLPQRMLNSYSKADGGEKYSHGDLAVRFDGCAKVGPLTCRAHAQEFDQEWREAFKMR